MVQRIVSTQPSHKCSEGEMRKYIFNKRQLTVGRRTRPYLIIGYSKFLNDARSNLKRNLMDLHYYLENEIDGVGFRGWRKQRTPKKQLCKDASTRPNVYCCAVQVGSQREFRGSVPQGNHHRSVGVEWGSEFPSQTKVANL